MDEEIEKITEWSDVFDAINIDVDQLELNVKRLELKPGDAIVVFC